ncbi:MAG: class II glutamine amidotransferase [Thermogutta sp.]
MSWLFGVITNKPADLSVSLRGLSEHGGDKSPAVVWGVGWYEGSRPRVVKQVHTAGTLSAGRSEFSPGESRLFLIHFAQDVSGTEKESDLHPFHYRHWLFTHTGVLDRDAFLPLLEETHVQSLNGDSSSEVFFHWIMQNIKKTRDLIPSLLDSLRDVGQNELSFLLSNGRWLFAYARGHNLYYSERRFPISSGHFCYEVPEVDAVVSSQVLANENAVVVSTDKLSDESWEQIPDAHLLVVTPRLDRILVNLTENSASPT